jgi:hypothetical protein
MKTMIIRLGALALVALALVTSAFPASAASFAHYDFEAGAISPWVKGADPGVPNAGLSVQAGDSFCGGTHYAELRAFAPFMPQSGVWMYSRHAVQSSTQPLTVTVRFAVKNKLNCPTCRAIAWIGDGMVASSNQFSAVGPIASTTWTVYTFQKTIAAPSGVVGVAVGWFGTPSGSPAKVAFDCIDVSINP